MLMQLSTTMKRKHKYQVKPAGSVYGDGRGDGMQNGGNRRRQYVGKTNVVTAKCRKREEGTTTKLRCGTINQQHSFVMKRRREGETEKPKIERTKVEQKAKEEAPRCRGVLHTCSHLERPAEAWN